MQQSAPRFLDDGTITRDPKSGSLVLTFATVQQPAPIVHCNKTGKQIPQSPSNRVSYSQEALFRRCNNKLRLGILNAADRSKVEAGKELMRLIMLG